MQQMFDSLNRQRLPKIIHYRFPALFNGFNGFNLGDLEIDQEKNNLIMLSISSLTTKPLSWDFFV